MLKCGKNIDNGKVIESKSFSNLKIDVIFVFHRFATGKFTDVRRPTIGADFLSKKIILHDTEIFVQVWDTAGQERFNSGTVGNAYFRGAHGALLVYDVTNDKSIDQIELWRDECLCRHDNSTFFPIVVIGNKTDLRDRLPEDKRIDQSHILAWCRQNSYGHIETSAKDGFGVDAAMLAVVALALEAQQSSASNNGKAGLGNGTNDRIDLSKKYEKPKGACDNCFL
jgi:Ras-related protein Rab-7A